MEPDEPATCGGCEYFDMHYGDCLRPGSPRFQTEVDSAACHLFYANTSGGERGGAKSRFPVSLMEFRRMTYPRFRNGYVDDGSPIRASNRNRSCPNCGSQNYTETVSREECRSCGLVCDYWGGGTNEVYERYLEGEHARQSRERQKHEDALRDEWDD